jgi:hypothetical protein
MTLEQLDLFQTGESSQPDSLVRICPSLESVRAWRAHVLGCGGTSFDSCRKHKPVGSSERTSLACYPATTGKTSTLSAIRWGNWVMGTPHGFLTLSGSEFPSAVAASSLSDILESPGPHLRKYFLSAKAAQGILRRAAKRGRALPPALQQALESLAALGGGLVPTVSSKWSKGSGGPSGDECQNLVLDDTHTHTHTHGFDVAGRRETRLPDRRRISSRGTPHRGRWPR